MISRLFLIGNFFFLSITVFSQLPHWAWAKGFGGTYNDMSYDLEKDNKNNLYMIGYFYNTLSFGNTTLIDTSIWPDIFVAKFDSSGNIKWAKSIGGSLSDCGYSITIDKSGNIYITGRFESPVMKFGNSFLTNLGGTDFFIAKYDSLGNELWAKCAGGNAEDQGDCIIADNNMNIYVTGHFHSSSISFGNITLFNGGYADYFIAKYDSSGEILWTKSAGGTYNDYGLSLYSDKWCNIFVTGFFSNPSMNVGNYNLSNQGSDDIFLIKYDLYGNVKWAQSGGGIGSDIGKVIDGDSIGNIYLSGSFHSPNLTFGNITISDTNNNDLFISKFDSSGNLLWLKGYGNSSDEVSKIIIDDSLNIYLSGYFHDNTMFDNFLLINQGQYDIFIVKLDTAGTVNWATSVGGVNPERCYGMSTIGTDVYITGIFFITTFGSTTLTYVGGTDIFLAKLSNFVSGIEKINDDSLIHIFPNPVTDRINIISSNKLKQIQIYNVLGQIVYSKDKVDLTFTIENIECGIYCLILHMENKIISKKIIIRK